MKEFPTFDHFFIEGDTKEFGQDEEFRIANYMDGYSQMLEQNETEAYTQASTIVLNC